LPDNTTTYVDINLSLDAIDVINPLEPRGGDEEKEGGAKVQDYRRD
jgi:hypothetical protein